MEGPESLGSEHVHRIERWPLVTISVGKANVAAAVSRIFSEISNIHIRGDPSSLDLNWLRDHQVILLDGTALDPTLSVSVEGVSEIIKKFAKTRFPHSIKKNRFFVGTGPSKARKKEVSEGISCIEGGNCKFWRIGNRTGAFVGVSSIALTMQTMLTKGLLSEEIIENRISQMGLEDSLTCVEKRHEAMQDIVVETVANDLKINKNNVIFLHHDLLHIDLHICIGPNNKIFMFDPRLSLEALNNIPSVTDFFRQSDLLLVDMIKNGIFEQNAEILTREGFEVIGVPGYFDTGLEEGGQFLNGLLFKDCNERFFLLSTPINSRHGEGFVSGYGKYEHRLAESFSGLLRAHGVTVLYMDQDIGLGGGVHCISKEERDDWDLYPPQYIPVNADLSKLEVPTAISLIGSYDQKLPSSAHISFYKTDGSAYQTISLDREALHRIELLVPVEGLSYSIFQDGVPVIENERILPGHCQRIRLPGIRK